MTETYLQNQDDRLREHFREHPYYKLCRTVFDVFQEECPTMVMTPCQLFEDAATTLDILLQTGDVSAERCQDLWTDKYRLYRERDGKAGGNDAEDTKTEAAMLFYMVMYGLQAVNHSHYRGTLQRTLHGCICKFYGREKCLDMERKLHGPVNRHTAGIMAWMEEYFTSTESMEEEIRSLYRPDGSAEQEQEQELEQDVVNQLAPIFYGSRTDAEDFFQRIRCMKPVEVTSLVNKLVKDKKISNMRRKKDLWRVLHDNGLYTPTVTNWNSQVK